MLSCVLETEIEASYLKDITVSWGIQSLSSLISALLTKAVTPPLQNIIMYEQNLKKGTGSLTQKYRLQLILR